MKRKHLIVHHLIGALFFLLILASGCASSGGSGDSTNDTGGSQTNDDTLGFTISSISGNTSEDGTTARFTVKLNTQPDADVAVDVISSDTGEGTISVSRLTFTAYNWSREQTVTVTGVDDGDKDGSQEYTIQLTIAPDDTYDTTGYGDLDPDDVSVINTDDDSPGFTIVFLDVTTSEGGGLGGISVRLNTPPNGNVVVDIASSDEGEGTVSDTRLTFTPSNWNSVQGTTVVGQDDSDSDDDQNYTVTLGINSGNTVDTTGYAGLDPLKLSMTNWDDEALPKVTVNSVSTTESTISFTWTDPAYTKLDYIRVVVDENTTTNINKGTETVTLSDLTVESAYSIQIITVDSRAGTSDPLTLILNTTRRGNSVEYSPVSTAAELDAVRNNLAGNYLLLADVDISSYSDWTPIGDDTTPFTGLFCGSGYAVKNLTIDGNSFSENYLGLFGYIQNGTVRNLGLTDVNIDVGNDYVGGLAGYVDATTVFGSYATGSVTGDDKVGGLIGSSLNSTISNSYTDVTVWEDETYGDTGGGLIGEITNSTLSNCYTAGSIHATDNGSVLLGISTNSTVSNCYAAGTAGSYIGYVYGLSPYGSSNYTVTNSFWDTQTTNASVSYGGTGKTTVEMKTIATFTDTDTDGLDAPWDFVGNPNDDTGNEDIWSIDSTVNNGYPYLTDLKPE